MKRVVAWIAAVWMAVSLGMCGTARAVDVSAQAAVLLCADTGEVLYSRNAHTRLPMASTTKIMTALLTLQAASPQRVVTVTADMVRVEGTSMGLLPGDRVTLYALACGMLLSSGNDAANTAAVALAGSTAAFAAQMNACARRIGMTDTHFVTPSGLDDETHYSTAYDMALLAVEALRDPVFRSICSARKLTVSYGDPPYPRTLCNHNRLLTMYDGCIGMKTGFTRKSGRCLVSAAQRDGVTLVAVTLHAPDDWNDHAALLDFGFSRVRCEPIEDAGTLSVPVVGSDRDCVPAVYASQPCAVTDSRTDSITKTVYLPPFLYAPVRQGDCVGRVEYRRAERTVCTVYLSAGADAAYVSPPVQEKEHGVRHWLDRIREVFTSWHSWFDCKNTSRNAASPPDGKRN